MSFILLQWLKNPKCFLYVCYISIDLGMKIEAFKTTHIRGNTIYFYKKYLSKQKNRRMSFFYMFANFFNTWLDRRQLEDNIGLPLENFTAWDNKTEKDKSCRKVILKIVLTLWTLKVSWGAPGVLRSHSDNSWSEDETECMIEKLLKPQEDFKWCLKQKKNSFKNLKAVLHSISH